MRLFHFVSSKHGLAAIRDQRYKVSTYDNLNDPFELFAPDFSDPEIRAAFRRWKNYCAKTLALLCCSKSWDSTLLWSHYADKHQGMALELEVKDSCVSHITYSHTRRQISGSDMDRNMSMPDGLGIGSELLTEKAACWSYEDEARIHLDLTRLQADENGLYFHRFNDDIELKAVILGPLCSMKASEIQAVLAPDVALTVKKARIAFRSYKVTDDLSYRHKHLAGLPNNSFKPTPLRGVDKAS